MEQGLRGWRRAARSGPRTLPSNVSHRVIRTPLGSAAEQPSEGFPSARSPDDVGPAHPVEVDDGHDAFPPPRPWWHDAVIYQVYPRSFQDADGDGVGNLAGIVRRLDYLTWLGVDAIWLSPIFPSPLVDFGYDVSDSTAVDPVYGTLDDLDRLLAEARPWAAVDPRPGPEPHLRPAPLVPGLAGLARRPQARLVPVARSRARRRAAQQLAEPLRRVPVGTRPARRPVLPAWLRAGAARPELAQPRGHGCDGGDHALLARPRRPRSSAWRGSTATTTRCTWRSTSRS